MTIKIEHITPLQYILCIHTTQTAAGVLTLPNIIAGTAGTDGWISIILGWLCTNVVGILIITTMKQNPNMNFLAILIQYFGKWLGIFLLLSYSIYFALTGFFSLLRCIDIVIVWILPHTPAYQIAFLLLIPFYILAKESIYAVCRYTEMIFFLTMFLPIILLFSLQTGFHPIHVLPVIKEGWGPIFKGLLDTIYPYSGLEITYVLYPYLHKKEKAIPGILIANTLTMCMLLYVTLLCFLHISPKGMKTIIWPVFSLLKGIHFSFLERFEILYVAYYLLMFSTTIIPYLFSATYTITLILPKIKRDYMIICLIFVLIMICFFLKFSVNDLLHVYNLIDNIDFIFFIGFPLFLCVYTYIFKCVRGTNLL